MPIKTINYDLQTNQYNPRTDDDALRPGAIIRVRDLKHDLLDGMSSAERKKYPVKTGVLDYFRDALFRVARVSYEGNEKHNPGQPLHWARGKSADHGDCHVRHTMCDDIEVEAAEAAWRALAHLQMLLEEKYNIKPPPGAK